MIRDARNKIPAVVELTRTSPGTAERQRGTARAGPQAPDRSSSGSQSLDQLLYPTEQGEDRHRQRDVNQDGHVAPVVYGQPDFGGLDHGTPCSRAKRRP